MDKPTKPRQERRKSKEQGGETPSETAAKSKHDAVDKTLKARSAEASTASRHKVAQVAERRSRADSRRRRA